MILHENDYRRYAVMDDQGIVVNIILVDHGMVMHPPRRFVLIRAGDARIGDWYDATDETFKSKKDTR